MEIVNKNNELKKTLQLSLFLSLSVILQIVESMIILPIFIPGIKLGLSNIVILIVIYTYGTKEALKLGIMKVFLASLFKVGFGLNFIFSIVGVVLSILSSGLLKKYSKLSIIGISVVGANFHILGQIIVASILYKTNILFVTYLPYMFLLTIVTGILVGYCGKEIISRVEIEKY